MLFFSEEGPEGEATEKGSKNVSLNLVLLQSFIIPVSYSYMIGTRVTNDVLPCLPFCLGRDHVQFLFSVVQRPEASVTR